MDVLGTVCRLVATRITLQGMYLDGGPRGEILLPGRYIPTGTIPGEAFTVFVHRDSEDRLVATPETPLAVVGEFAALKVVGIAPRIGAFLGWGVGKDLLLPLREQRSPVRMGETVVVRIFVDSRTDRIVASTRLERHTDEVTALSPDDRVSLMIAWETPLGYMALINGSRLGLLYKNEISGRLAVGERRDGFVKSVRIDGKVDLTLHASGHRRAEPIGEKVLSLLAEAGGRLPYGDKSAPDEIFRVFGCSKKAFKQAIGGLFRERRIRLTDDAIELVAPLPRGPGK
jgi:predicted RNA-binding protein (virulence factor B family)